MSHEGKTWEQGTSHPILGQIAEGQDDDRKRVHEPVWRGFTHSQPKPQEWRQQSQLQIPKHTLALEQRIAKSEDRTMVWDRCRK